MKALLVLECEVDITCCAVLPYLICVDEIANGISKDYRYDHAIKVLISRLDSDPLFYTTVSALHAKDVVRLSTDSQRRLLLQTLGPLWFNDPFDKKYVSLLPTALRPFFDERQRNRLPFTDPAKDLYDKLSQLMLVAAGHPRRLEVLFNELNDLD